MIDRSKFRNASGTILTARLFLEMTPWGQDSNILYTLKRQDDLKRGIPSLFRLYMEMEDPLEYDFANTFFESYEHWEQLCNTTWFKEYIMQWRKELDIKLRAKALRTIREIANAPSQSAKAFEASKFLLSDGWNRGAKEEPKRGRPSKEEIQRAAGELAEEASLLKEDSERLGIN